MQSIEKKCQSNVEFNGLLFSALSKWKIKDDKRVYHFKNFVNREACLIFLLIAERLGGDTISLIEVFPICFHKHLS